MSPLKKKKAAVYRSCCQSIVKSVHDRVNEEGKNRQLAFGLTRNTARIQYYTGLSAATIFKLQNDENILQEGEHLHLHRDAQIPVEDLAVIRPAILQLLINKITPTLDSILVQIQNDNPDFKWSRSTVYRNMEFIGFKYNSKRYNYYDKVRENLDNVALRIKYIQMYTQHVHEGRQIVYMDESWINKNCVPAKAWHDGTAATVDAIPPGKGDRWIMIGAGSKEGWINHSFRMWKGNIKSEDYHSEMCGDVFRHWVHNYLLPNVNSNAVIVIDRATYHLELTEDSKPAANSATKDVLKQWLIDRNAVSDSGELFTMENLAHFQKPFIWALCQERKPLRKYKIMEWLQEWNELHDTDIIVNILPIAHPQLNPIELIWNWIKTYVKTHNHDFSMPLIRTLAHERVQQLDGEFWLKSYNKSDRFATDCITTDNIYMEQAESVNDDISVECDYDSDYDNFFIL